MSHKIYYYGIKSDFTYEQFEEEECPFPQKEDTNYEHFIKRTYLRESSSGIFKYYKSEILDKYFKPSIIEIDNLKLMSVSDEIWCDIGTYNKSTAPVFYFPNYQRPCESYLLENDFFYCLDFLLFKIENKPSGFKICFFEIIDDYGYRKFVPYSIDTSYHIQDSFNHLQCIAYFKSYKIYRLYKTLLNLTNINYKLFPQNTRIYFEKNVDKWYLEFTKEYTIETDPCQEIHKMYHQIRDSIF